MKSSWRHQKGILPKISCSLICLDFGMLLRPSKFQCPLISKQECIQFSVKYVQNYERIPNNCKTMKDFNPSAK